MSTTKSGMNKMWLLIAIVALLALPMIGLVGCGEEEITEKDIDEIIDEAIEEVTDHTIEVTEFTCPVTPDSDTGEPLEEDNIFASVNVTIKNESDVEQVTGSANFYLEDEDGTRYDSSMFYDAANSLGIAETIAPGEEVSGVIVFEIPADAKPKYIVEEGIVGEDIKTELPAPKEG